MSEAAIEWPARFDVIGSPVSATTYAEATECILAAAKARLSVAVSCHAVHAVVASAGDPQLAAKVRRFKIVCPDGQPVRWALRWLHGVQLPDRVYGPELTLRLCRAAADQHVSIFLYGSSPQTLLALQENLLAQIPNLRIAGALSPPFRQLTSDEDRASIERINASGAGIVFVGLGCPKQDHFAGDHLGQIQAVQVCVGAAFDFHAGFLPMAPHWMQRRGLEWLFRLWQEPKRLCRRYLVTNTIFLLKLAAAWSQRRFTAADNGKFPNRVPDLQAEDPR